MNPRKLKVFLFNIVNKITPRRRFRRQFTSKKLKISPVTKIISARGRDFNTKLFIIILIKRYNSNIVFNKIFSLIFFLFLTLYYFSVDNI